MRKASQFLDIEQSLDPEECGSVADGTGFHKSHAARQKFRPAGGIYDPAGLHLLLTGWGFKRDDMRETGVGKNGVEIGNARLKSKILVFQVQSKQFFFKLVPVQLVTGDVGKTPNIRLAIVFVGVIFAAGRLPIEAKIVFHQVLAKEVLLEIQ